MAVKANQTGTEAPTTGSGHHIDVAELTRPGREIVFVPKIAPSLISALYGKRAPYGGIIIGRTSTAEQEARGRYGNPFHRFLGEFMLIVRRPTDQQLIEHRANIAIVPTSLEAMLLMQLADNPNTVIDFAFRLTCSEHPTNPQLSMWTHSPLSATQGPDRLSALLAAVTQTVEGAAAH
jgi:hypothetical protein